MSQSYFRRVSSNWLSSRILEGGMIPSKGWENRMNKLHERHTPRGDTYKRMYIIHIMGIAKHWRNPK